MAAVSAAEWRVAPSEIRLDRPEAMQQLLISEYPDPAKPQVRHDLTRTATYRVQHPEIARVDERGVVHPLREGTTTVDIEHAGQKQAVSVTVTGLVEPPPISFEQEIQPVLTKFRCNSGGCHGKAEGQNGFKLSLFGFDAPNDYASLVKESRGRRVALSAPHTSLLLLKGAALMPHGGGKKLEPESVPFQRLTRWIDSGAPETIAEEHPVVRIEIEPAELILQAGDQQQIQVTAIDDTGKRHCVTVEAEFISNRPHLVDADARGLLTAGTIPGDAAILVRHLGHVAVCRIARPLPTTNWQRPPVKNFIDPLVWNKLEQLGIQPSAPVDDATFVRRVYLDTIGTLPTAEEARTFLDDPGADKRDRLIDQLLSRPEYADYWAMNWSNLLRADKIKITSQGTVGMTRWLRRQFAQNRPYDELVREILTAQGPVQSEGPASLFRSLDQPELASRSISQLFLGVRIECAQCHHHPSERWSQDDYAALAGFFSGMSVKKLPDGTDAIVSRGGTDMKHPRTGELVPARALAAPTADFSQVTDRRQILAQWMTSHDNAFFARAIANRVWAHYFGTGIVEPLDDIRVTNPAANEALLVALEQHLRDVKFDLKAFTKTLLQSQVYQLSGETNETNRYDQQMGSHALPKPLAAEVLLDAISQSTGTQEKFEGWPLGVRAIQVWDNRMPSYFFRIFGRPVRATVCECERSNEPSITQALHLLNSPEVQAKIAARQGLSRKLAESELTPEQIVETLYLTTLSRRPTVEELPVLLGAFEEGTDRRQAAEDVLWTILNTKEFLFNH